MAIARVTKSVQEARDQASEYFGFPASSTIEVGEKRFEIPNPGLMDDDQQERWVDLQFELEQCDREPDTIIPEHTLTDGTVIPHQVVTGALKEPYRKDGALMRPPYAVRVAQAILGGDYAAFKAAGGSGSYILVEWARMNDEFKNRVDVDPKSGGSDSPLESVS